ncbi:hypothetical protein DFH28DRAFT_1081315 [Melampsora americana]|nr:hypothetical protein DFH28DRAFT_1081315 [Melampsora americana]
MYHHHPYSSHQHHTFTTPLQTSLHQNQPAVDLDSRLDHFNRLDPLSGYSDGLNQLKKNDFWVPNHGTFLSNTGQRKTTGLLGIFEDSPSNLGYHGGDAFKNTARSNDLGQLENTSNTYKSTGLFIPRDATLAFLHHLDRNKISKVMRHPPDCNAQGSPSVFDTSTSVDSFEDHPWSTSSYDYEKLTLGQPPTVSNPSSPDVTSPILCDKWPIVRVDNISWGSTVAGISNWLPSQDCLPPPALCPLPIHILCTAVDGKTLNYCFIETRNLASAHLLVRHRHATKLNMRPCSVGLTSLKELHENIAPDYPKGIMTTAEELLRLCMASTVKELKAPERPFLHLVSIILHYPGLPGDQLYSVAQGRNRSGEEHTRCERLRMIYILAMQSLISAHDWVPPQFGLVGLLDEVPNQNRLNNGNLRTPRDNIFGSFSNHPQAKPTFCRPHLGLEKHQLLPPAQDENQSETLLHKISRSRIPNMRDGDKAYACL